MPFFQVLLFLFIITSSPTYAMEDDLRWDKEKCRSLISKNDIIISQYKKSGAVHPHREKNTQIIFEAYMQKAAGHFHLGERDKQLGCYKEILNMSGLSKLNLARTHVNISVVYVHLEKSLLASGHLQKAEELASLEDIEKVIGAQIYKVFGNTYAKTAQDLYLTHPEMALEYNKKALSIPHQDEGMYGRTHLNLAVCYDRFLNSKDSLSHALQALNCKALAPIEHTKALCYASLGSWGIDKNNDCIRYFEQIKNLKNLYQNEYFLLLTTVGSCYLSMGNWDKGIALRHQANNSLEPSAPEYLFVKYNLATAYGMSGHKEKEMEFYDEILEAIKNNTFEKSWGETFQSIQTSIETFYFMEEWKRHLHERSQQENKGKSGKELQKSPPSLDEKKLERKQGKEKRKETFRQKRIEVIKQAQREAVEREQKLEDERKKKAEEEKRSADKRKSHIPSSSENSCETPSSSVSSRYVLEQKTPKIKTRGIPLQTKIPKEETVPVPEVLSPTLPKLGTRAHVVFNQIEDEDWSFTREEYMHYLEDLGCKRRENGSSHRIFQLPKTTIITLEKNGQEIQEHVFLADKDVKLGSVTLPPWVGKQLPFYLRKQLRNLHDKIIKLYTKVATIQTNVKPENI